MIILEVGINHFGSVKEANNYLNFLNLILIFNISNPNQKIL